MFTLFKIMHLQCKAKGKLMMRCRSSFVPLSFAVTVVVTWFDNHSLHLLICKSPFWRVSCEGTEKQMARTNGKQISPGDGLFIDFNCSSLAPLCGHRCWSAEEFCQKRARRYLAAHNCATVARDIRLWFFVSSLHFAHGAMHGIM